MKSILYITLCLWLLNGTCQSGSSVTGYLKTAGSDQQLERFLAERNFLQVQGIKSSWIRETEIRLGTKGLDASVEDYRLRISPTNPWEIKANKSYQNQLVENVSTRYKISYSKALKSRYELLLNHYFLNRLITLAEEEITFRREIGKQAIRLQKEEIDVEDVIRMESGLSKKEIERSELQIELNEYSDLIALDFDQEITWGSYDFISPNTIQDVLAGVDSAEHGNLYKLEASQKLMLEDKMYRVNKAEAFSNIGFLQAQYETDQGDDFEEHMGFRVGITLPLANRDRADLSRDRFEMIEAENEKQVTEQLIDQQVKMLRSRLKASLELFRLLEEKLDRANALKPSANSEIDLSSILRYITYTSELKEKQAETYRSIVDDFIDYLDLQGVLVQEPVRNYLSDSLHELEIRHERTKD